MTKNHHNRPENFAIQFDLGELKMRIAKAIFVGSVFALALTMPAFAKHTEAQKTEDKSSATSPSCHAYQQAEDGSWVELPCQEAGAQTQRKQPSKGTEAERR